VMLQHFGKVNYFALQNYLHNNFDKHNLMNLEMTTDCPESEQYVTTQCSLEREAYSVEKVNKGTEVCMPFNEKFEPFNTPEILKYEKEANINFDDQRILVKDILVTRDRYINVRGKAGTGKTTMLKELERGINEKEKQKTVFLAPTNAAVDALKEAGLPGRTVSKFLLTCHDLDRRNLTIVVDEAGLLSSKQGSQLLYVAEKYDWRILFCGDTHQHSSVEAGDFVRGLEDYSKILTLNLSTINRQQSKIYKHAVELLADNKTKEGLQILDKHKWITERTDYIRTAVESFEKKDFTTSGRCLFVAPTNREVEQLNDRIRERIKSFNKEFLKNEEDKTIFIQSSMTAARSKLAINYAPADSIQIQRRFQEFKRGEYYQIKSIDTDRNRIILENNKSIKLANHFSHILHGTQKVIQLAEGERIICTARDKKHDLFNGESLTVKEMHCKVDGEDLIKCENSNGKVKFMPQDFQHFKYAYAVTSHRSQGATVDRVVVAAGSLKSDSAYVALSRGKLSCQIYTPNKTDLIENAMDYTRPLAMDILNKEDKKYHLEFTDYHEEVQRIEAEREQIENMVEKEEPGPEKSEITIESLDKGFEQISKDIIEALEPDRAEKIVEPKESPIEHDRALVNRLDHQEVSRMRDEETQLLSQKRELEKELIGIPHEIERINEYIGNTREGREDLDEKIKNLERGLEKAEKKSGELNSLFQPVQSGKVKNDIERINGELKPLKDERNRFDNEKIPEIEELEKKIESMEQNIEKTKDDISELDQKIEDNQNEINDYVISSNNGIVWSSDLCHLQSLSGVNKIMRDVNFSNVRSFHLGDVTEVTGDANFRESSFFSLGQIESVGGTLDLRDTEIMTLDKLKTVKGNVYSNQYMGLEQWKNIDIEGKLYNKEGKDITDQYHELRTPKPIVVTRVPELIPVDRGSTETPEKCQELLENSKLYFEGHRYSMTLDKMNLFAENVKENLDQINDILKDLRRDQYWRMSKLADSMETDESKEELSSFLVEVEDKIERYEKSEIGFKELLNKADGRLVYTTHKERNKFSEVIKGEDISKFESLQGIKKIIGDVYFSRTKCLDLGDVAEITGKAVFTNSDIYSLGNLKTVGSLDLENSMVDDLGNLQTVHKDVVTNDLVRFKQWKGVEIGRSIFAYDVDITDKYHELQHAPVKETEYHDRGREIDFGGR